MKKKRIILAVICMLVTGLILAGCKAEKGTDDTVVRIGALKGPTTLGLLPMLNEQTPPFAMEFSMMTSADELLPLMIKGELDIALLPANVASVLYQKSQGEIQVIDINTLSVLYLVSSDTGIATPADLAGKEIFLTGKGTTPDYALRYVLAQNGLGESDYQLTYKSEATEVAAALSQSTGAIGLLPQPFVTVACAQNEELSVVMDLGKEWEACQSQSSIVTGVTVVRKEFLQQHEALVDKFVEEHKKSAESMVNDSETGAKLAVDQGIIPKEPIARKAIPDCNIVCITGEEMKTGLSGYLQILYEQNPASVGGALPGDDFYRVK